MIGAKELRERRKLAGYRSQVALAEALGVSPRLVWEWENSKEGVGVDHELAVRKLLWPEPPNIREFDDWELLIEVARRLAEARGDTQPNRDLPEPETEGKKVQDPPTVRNVIDPKKSGRFTGRSGGPNPKGAE